MLVMRAFVYKWLFELSGFNPEVMKKLGTADQFTLFTWSIWGLIGTFLSAFSVAYLVHYSTESILSSLVSFVLCFFILVSLHVLLVTSSGMELQTKAINRSQWLPSRYRPFTYLVVSILFSQSIILAFLSMSQQLEANVSIHNLDLQIESIKNRYSNYSSLKNLRLLQLVTYRNIADKEAPDVTAIYAKKALLIDDGDASQAINNLKDKLLSLGFDVTLIPKTYGANLDIKVKNYYEHINTGDISIFVYRGPSRVALDNSLELIQPTSGMLSHSVDVDSLISIIANKKVLASYFIFSLPPEISDSKTIRQVKWESRDNTYIASLNDDLNGDLINALINSLGDSDELNKAMSSSVADFAADDKKYHFVQSSPQSLPVFLIWRSGLFHKVMNKSEMENLIPLTDYCKAYTALEQSTFAKCLEAEEKIVNSELQFINEVREKNIQSIEAVKVRKLQNPSMVVNYTGWLSKHIFLSILLTLIAIVIVAGSYIVRDFIVPHSIVKYESKSVQLSRVRLHQQFKEYRKVVTDIRQRFSNEGEQFDEIVIQHPLYKVHNKERKKKPNSDGDDLYQILSDALRNNIRSTYE